MLLPHSQTQSRLQFKFLYMLISEQKGTCHSIFRKMCSLQPIEEKNSSTVMKTKLSILLKSTAVFENHRVSVCRQQLTSFEVILMYMNWNETLSFSLNNSFALAWSANFKLIDRWNQNF